MIVICVDLYREVRRKNSTKSRTEKLDLLQMKNGHIPHVAKPALEELLVPENERLPSGGINTWNRDKSKTLLKSYGELQADEDSDSEDSFKSRELRLRIATTLGVTRAQLNFAQLAL